MFIVYGQARLEYLVILSLQHLFPSIIKCFFILIVLLINDPYTVYIKFISTIQLVIYINVKLKGTNLLNKS